MHRGGGNTGTLMRGSFSLGPTEQPGRTHRRIARGVSRKQAFLQLLSVGGSLLPGTFIPCPLACPVIRTGSCLSPETVLILSRQTQAKPMEVHCTPAKYQGCRGGGTQDVAGVPASKGRSNAPSHPLQNFICMWVLAFGCCCSPSRLSGKACLLSVLFLSFPTPHPTSGGM